MFKMNDFRPLGMLAGVLLAVPPAFAAAVPPAELAHALQWRSLGPYRGGIVETVAGIAGEPNHYYMGAGGGGVWESRDYGSSWKNISDKYFKNNNIGAIAVSPSNPKVIYVGTGNSAFRNTFLTGDGMHKSTDGGRTWSNIGLEKTGIISWIIVVWIDDDPADDSSLLQPDGGRTWSNIGLEKTGIISWIIVDPNDANVV